MLQRLLQVTVEVKCTFLKINDIDTVNQQFEAEIFVQAKWEEPLLQQSLYASGDQVISTSPDKVELDDNPENFCSVSDSLKKK